MFLEKQHPWSERNMPAYKYKTTTFIAHCPCIYISPTPPICLKKRVIYSHLTHLYSERKVFVFRAWGVLWSVLPGRAVVMHTRLMTLDKRSIIAIGTDQ